MLVGDDDDDDSNLPSTENYQLVTVVCRIRRKFLRTPRCSVHRIPGGP